MNTSNTSNTKQIKAIAAAVSKATHAFTDGQRSLCAALIRITSDAVAIGADGVAAYREAMLAERELHDCKNIRNYYSTLAGRAVYIAQLEPDNCKTLSGLLSQTQALRDLQIKAHDVVMSKAKADALAAQATLDEAARLTAHIEKEAQTKLDALADSTDEVAKARWEAKAKQAKADADAAQKAKADADKIAAQSVKKADAAATAAQKVDAKVTAATNQDKPKTQPQPQPQHVEKQESTNLKGAVVEAQSLAAELTGLFATFCLSNKKSIREKIEARLATLAMQLAHVIAECK